MVEAPTAESVALGPPRQNDSQETPVKKSSSLKPSWKEITVSFIMRTKIHGLKFVFSPDKSKPQRVIWIMAFFVCVSLLCTWSWNRILYLMSYPAITKIYMVWAHNMSFPAVTFCNKNVFRASTLTKDDLYHSGYWMDLMYPNHTVMEKSLSILKDSHKQGLLSLLDFNNYSPHPDYRINTTEMMGRLGHQLEDMLLECRFRGEACTYKNFSTVCTEKKYGVCQVLIWMLFARCINNSCRHLKTHPPAATLAGCCKVLMFQSCKQACPVFTSPTWQLLSLLNLMPWKRHSRKHVRCHLHVVHEKSMSGHRQWLHRLLYVFSLYSFAFSYSHHGEFLSCQLLFTPFLLYNPWQQW